MEPVETPAMKARQDPTQKQPERALVCPRCESSNTKFCYYNNYTKSQPRHYCRSCKRYWTAGGSLRNVPSGGRPEKKRRGKASSRSRSMKGRTSERSGCGDTRVGVVGSCEGLGQKSDTQLADQQKDESFGGISAGFGRKDESFCRISAGLDRKDESFGGISSAVVHKDESFGRISAGSDRKDESFGRISAGYDRTDESFGKISSGFDQKDATDILHKNHGLSDFIDVVARSPFLSLFDHEVLSFELPVVSDLINTGMNGDDHQQLQLQWQLPNTSDMVGKEMRWEDHYHDSLCVTDFLTMDVPQLSK